MHVKGRVAPLSVHDGHVLRHPATVGVSWSAVAREVTDREGEREYVDGCRVVGVFDVGGGTKWLAAADGC